MAGKAGTYMAENPLATAFMGTGLLNQMTAPGVGEYPMADFSTLQGQKTYDQTLGHMSIEELTNEMSKPGLSPDQRNSIARAMEQQGLDQDRIYEARVRGTLGEQRYADVNEAVNRFNETTNISDADVDAKTALILANYNAQTDPQYDKAESQLNAKWADAGRYLSRGHDDAFSSLAEARARTGQDNQQRAEAETLRRMNEMAGIRQQRVNAILAGANYGDVQSRWDANFNENSRRYKENDLNSQRDSNYSTSLLGLQGATNANLAKYQADQNAANAQAVQGLEMTKLGMRGFGDLVPLGSRNLYDSYNTGYSI